MDWLAGISYRRDSVAAKAGAGIASCPEEATAPWAVGVAGAAFRALVASTTVVEISAIAATAINDRPMTAFCELVTRGRCPPGADGGLAGAATLRARCAGRSLTRVQDLATELHFRTRRRA